MKYSTKIITGIAVAMPHIVLAGGVYESSHFTNFRSLVVYLVRDIMRPLVSILFAAMVVYFLWGLLQYVRSAEESDGRTEGRERMIWGIIAIAVVAALWTLVRIVVRTLS